MFNNSDFVKLIRRLYLKLYMPFESIFRLSETEKKGSFLKLTYCKILVSPTVQLPYKLGRTIRGTKFDIQKTSTPKLLKRS